LQPNDLKADKPGITHIQARRTYHLGLATLSRDGTPTVTILLATSSRSAVWVLPEVGGGRTHHEGERDMTKTELERAVADAAGVEKRTAAAVLDALEEIVTKSVRKGEPVTIRPGFIKVSRKDVKARKAREGTNPFTGEPTTFKARPASKTAKLTALKKLKDGVGGKSR
jgi:nucleoid DNA-binding protein